MIYLNNAGDITSNRAYFCENQYGLYKRNGCWYLYSGIGNEDFHADPHLFNVLAETSKLKLKNIREDFIFYKFNQLDFDTDKKHYKKIIPLIYGRRFYAVKDIIYLLENYGYDCKLDDFDNMLPECRALYIEKGENFRITIPYYSKTTTLTNKDALFKILCRIVCALYFPGNFYPYAASNKRDWELKFDFVGSKVLEWCKKEG